MGYDVSRGTVYAKGSPIPRELRDRFADIISIKDFGAKGDGTGVTGAGGVPSASSGVFTAVAVLRVDPAGTADFRDANSIFSGFVMNLSGTNPEVNGYSSHAIKLYVERCASSAPVAVAAGDEWRCCSRYGLTLVPDALFNQISA